MSRSSFIVEALREGASMPKLEWQRYNVSPSLCVEAANRITALENACQSYLDAYDSATGTVYVEPVIRAVMEAKNV